MWPLAFLLLQCECSVPGVDGDGPHRQRRFLFEVRPSSPGPQGFGHHGLDCHFDRYLTLSCVTAALYVQYVGDASVSAFIQSSCVLLCSAKICSSWFSHPGHSYDMFVVSDVALVPPKGRFVANELHSRHRANAVPRCQNTSAFSLPCRELVIRQKKRVVKGLALHLSPTLSTRV